MFPVFSDEPALSNSSSIRPNCSRSPTPDAQNVPNHCVKFGTLTERSARGRQQLVPGHALGSLTEEMMVVFLE
jgi:hypothetical protein